MRKYAPKV
ncbi:UNVERIFIED_CONTAM: hypothetical protein GTU68_034401 [Idotea baltica]|nr:hypothetical protein [Idotea baltica]